MPVPQDCAANREPGPEPGRRALLALGLTGAVLPWLAGCTGGQGPADRSAGSSAASGSSAADTTAARRAAQLADTLARAHRSAADRATGASARALHTRLATDHASHLVALGGMSMPSSTPSTPVGTPSGTGHGTGSTTTLTTAAQLHRAERDGALAVLATVGRLSPAVAVLLTRVAACRAAHADLLAAAGGGRAPGIPAAPDLAVVPVTGTPAGAPSAAPARLDLPARASLADLVAGEHAAAYGYGVVAARTAGAQAERARAAWQWHLDRRDVYATALRAAGGRVPPAAAAYDLAEADDPTATAATAVALAGRIERALLGHLLNAVAQVTGSTRTVLARDTIEAARRVERWTGELPALP